MKEKRVIYFTKCKMQNCKLAGGGRGLKKKWYNADSDNQAKKKVNQRRKDGSSVCFELRKDMLGLPSNHRESRVARRMGSNPETSCVTTTTTTELGWF